MFSVRLMMPDDLPAVLEIQSACYPAHLHESAEALLAKVQNFSSSCYLVEKAGKAVAYLFAHEWAGHLPPAFDAPLAICDGRPHFYLHDLAVDPGQRGSGLGECLWLAARRSAQNAGHAEIRLIAVAGAQSFWSRLGFTVVQDDLPGLAAKLQEYGGEASLMRYRF